MINTYRETISEEEFGRLTNRKGSDAILNPVHVVMTHEDDGTPVVLTRDADGRRLKIIMTKGDPLV